MIELEKEAKELQTARKDRIYPHAGALLARASEIDYRMHAKSFTVNNQATVLVYNDVLKKQSLITSPSVENLPEDNNTYGEDP